MAISPPEGLGIEYPTLNSMGWTSSVPHEINLAFAEYSATCGLPVLDIGAGYGVAAKEALCRGAEVTVNDLSESHLTILRESLSPDEVARATICAGRFPRELQFDAGSFGAIHASNVFHFLTTGEFDLGLEQLHRWLAPGGRVFVLTGSPYQQHLHGFSSEFERRKLAGLSFPGWVDDIREYNSHPLLNLIPRSMLLFDAELLSAQFEVHGFEVLEAKNYTRSGIPEVCRFDGRENVFLIARR